MALLRSYLLVLLLCCGLQPVVAQDPLIQIDWPPPVYHLQGTVNVHGTVNPPDLQSYYLEVAPLATDQWFPASLPATTPITAGVIAQWVTNFVPDGLYTLRLNVRLKNGALQTFSVSPLRIANDLAGASAPVPVPQVTATPRLTNDLPLPVGGQVLYFSETTQTFMQDAGMTWVKWQVPFVIGDTNLLNVARDRIQWSHEAGFNVLLSITGEVPELAERGAAYYPLYAAFVGEVAGLGADAIEIWNEMNLDREWPQGQINPAAYADLLKPAYSAIKTANPNTRVITGALAPTGAEGAFGLERVWNDDRYYLGMANAGVAQFADCIGVHYNEGIIPPNQQGGDPRQPDYPTRYLPLMIQRAAFPFRGQNIPLCFTELGYLSAEGYPALPEGFAWAQKTSVAEQAAWLRDAVLVASTFTGATVDLMIVFNMDFDRYDADPQAGFGIIRPDGTCPACAALNEIRFGEEGLG